MLAGAVYMEACVESPGVMRYLSGARRVVFGELSGPITPRIHGLHAGQCRREYGVLGHFCGAKHLDHPPRYGGVVAKTLFTRKPPRLSPERLAGQWGNPRRPIGWAAAPGRRLVDVRVIRDPPRIRKAHGVFARISSRPEHNEGTTP